ncbi:RRM_1 domain-containing protein [Cephalotus follicularis]|uniref:RRM_1 domain-containing protein n=1 Tax=Cephalotus follicularis TaxID=3775 RepID=A0A1Q3D1Z3_CEPFO|nr:RRM_1 domain-containing protein [Cephalotus follicularis]
MRRKRDKLNTSRDAPTSLSKRRRPPPPPPPPPPPTANNDRPATKPAPPPAVVVMGLAPDCSVLDLKSRFQIYGPISRIRIDRGGVGSITYRTKDAAEAAISAALDASFGITLDSKRVQVLWATDPLAQWREGVGVGVNKEQTTSSSSLSKLVRAEVPLSRHGRGKFNKIASAIVNPASSSSSGGDSLLDVPFKGREIVAYDDII